MEQISQDQSIMTIRGDVQVRSLKHGFCTVLSHHQLSLVEPSDVMSHRHGTCNEVEDLKYAQNPISQTESPRESSRGGFKDKTRAAHPRSRTRRE